MAIRVKTKWHRSRRGAARSDRPKTLTDLASVVAFNVWKIAQEAFRRMEKEGFRFALDAQVTSFITEFIAYLTHSVDRMIYGNIDDAQRTEFMNALIQHLARTMAENQRQLLGEGNYEAGFIETINARFDQYSECGFSGEFGPSFEMTRGLAAQISAIMNASDDRWVIEQVMDIEAPGAVKTLQRVVRDVLGMR